MKTLRAFGIGIVTGGLIFGLNVLAHAQNFRETQDLWKSETIRARSIDTVKIEKHSFFLLPSLSDTTPLVYYEPMPDSVMPKAAIEIGQITIQAGSAEEVVAMLEKQARAIGADWIIGFNEPRMKFNKDHEVYYRSQAMLYKVINSELVPESQIVYISCGENHLQNCGAVEAFVTHTVAKSGE